MSIQSRRVTLSSVRKHYGDIEAVRDLNLEVGAGELVSILGPSGCGKSTTLSVIAGLEELTAGSIAIGDTEIQNVPPNRRNVAMVFQDYALYPHMRVWENLTFRARLARVPKRERRVQAKQVAAILGIEDLLDRYPKELSGGQRQRVALGRAIAREPAVFLFDEPLSNLDERLRVQIRAELRRLVKSLGITSVYVTHDQAEALSLADRIAVMKDGIIQQCDVPLEIYRRPVNLFVAQFVGNPPINLIRGHLEGGRQQEYVFRSADRTGEDGSSLEVLLSPVDGDRATSLDGREVVMAIRPEDWLVSGPNEPGLVRGHIAVVQPTGIDCVLSVESTLGTEITVVLGRKHSLPKEGDSVGLSLSGEVMAFCANTEKAIAFGSAIL